jgi:hypothetical protein
MSLTNDFFIEEEIEGRFFWRLDEPVNDFLQEMELKAPPLLKKYWTQTLAR